MNSELASVPARCELLKECSWCHMENRFKEAKIEAELDGGRSKMEMVWHYTDGRPECGCGVCVWRGWLTGPSEKSGRPMALVRL